MRQLPVGTKILFPFSGDDLMADQGWGYVDEIRGTNEYHIIFDDKSEGWYDETHTPTLEKNYGLVFPYELDEELFTL
jgi:hypothetical protein